MRRLPLSLFLAAGFLAVDTGSAFAQAVGTSFTYQGSLSSMSVPASGLHDLKFRLFDATSGGAQVGPELCVNDVSVVDGQFAILLDFGAQFSGASRHIEIDVRADTGLDCSDQTGYDTLAPRQNITPAPYALFALNGTPGPEGPQGPIGPAGPTGPAGPQGNQGLVGPVGPQGPQGAQGPEGQRGLEGLRGPQGSSGPMGLTGPTGATGPVGPQGPAGASPWSFTAGSGTAVLDQVNDTLNASAVNVFNSWQSFTAGITGVMTRLEYGGFRQTGDFNATCHIYSGEGTGGTLLATIPFVVAGGSGPATLLTVDINPLVNQVNLTAGQVYTFQITSGTGYRLPWGIATSYGGGRGSVPGITSGNADIDLRFRTYVTQNYTPPQTSIAAAVSMTGPLTATSLSGDGAGLTNVNAVSAATATNATQLNGQPPSFYQNASNLATGTLPNARTTATASNTANTIVARDAAGNFSAGTIFASLSGNASTATSATSATNATLLGGQPASFYTNASNLSTGDLPVARMPSGGNWVLTTSLNVDGGALVIDPANTRVGIGEAAPSSPLHVTAANIAAANNWMVRITNTTGGTGGIRISNDGFLDITNVVQGGTSARLNSTGIWGTFSDRRLKKDIEPALGNLEAAMRLRPVTYAMIHDDPGTPRHLGFIAQEVREVIPEYVMGDEAKGNLAVAYGQMSVVAIGAIQELKAELDALKARVKELESAKGMTTATRN